MSSSNELTIQQVLKEIVLSQNDLKNAIQASETRIRLDLETLKKKVSFLEKENTAKKEH